MPRVCTICVHPDREAIESAVIEGISYRDIARQFTVSKDSIARHKENCVKPAIQDARVKQTEQSVWNAISEMQWMHQQVHLIYTESRAAKDNRIALQALGEDRKQTELYSELLGSTEQSTEKEMEQEWLNLREIIFHALKPFPDALLAVARALLVVAEYGDDHSSTG